MVYGIPLYWYLIVSAALFCIGLYGVMARQNGIAVLMSLELMLNSININLVAFWRFITPASVSGLTFAAFIFIVAAAEAAVGLALIISVYRNTRGVDLEKIDTLKE